MSSYKELVERGLDDVRLATSLDSAGLYTEALEAYRSGVAAFLAVLKVEKNPAAIEALRKKVGEYLNRAEVIKQFLDSSSSSSSLSSSPSPSCPSATAPLVDLDAPSATPPTPPSIDVSPYPLQPAPHPLHAPAAEPPPHPAGAEPHVAVLHTVRIAEGERGHTYQSLFGQYAAQVESVVLADPYLRERHQFFNLIRFAEMLVSAKSVRLFSVVTKADDELQKAAVGEFMTDLAASLLEHHVTLRYSFDEHLHDREVHFEPKFIARLGRGLDFYHKPASRFCVGLNDYALRPCKQTVIDVYAVHPRPPT